MQIFDGYMKVGVGIALLILGTIAMLANYALVIGYFRKKPAGSLIPVIGGFFACAGLSMAFPDVGHWAWAPLILDVGCIPSIIGAAIGWYFRR